MRRPGMGDAIEKALALVGVTEERIKKYVLDCKCRDRKRRYNEIDEWATGVVKGLWGGIMGAAKDKLNEILGKDADTKEAP